MEAAKFKYNHQKYQNVHKPDTQSKQRQRERVYVYVCVQEIHGVRKKKNKNWLGMILNSGKLDHKNKTLKCSFVTIKYIVDEKHLAITMDFICWTTE